MLFDFFKRKQPILPKEREKLFNLMRAMNIVYGNESNPRDRFGFRREGLKEWEFQDKAIYRNHEEKVIFVMHGYQFTIQQSEQGTIFVEALWKREQKILFVLHKEKDSPNIHYREEDERLIYQLENHPYKRQSVGEWALEMARRYAISADEPEYIKMKRIVQQAMEEHYQKEQKSAPHKPLLVKEGSSLGKPIKKDPLADESSESNHQDSSFFANLRIEIQTLLEEREHLDDDEYHRLSSTYPSDFAELETMYQQLDERGKERIMARIKHTIHHISDDLAHIRKRVEERNVRAMTIKLEIMKKRGQIE